MVLPVWSQSFTNSSDVFFPRHPFDPVFRCLGHRAKAGRERVQADTWPRGEGAGALDG